MIGKRLKEVKKRLMTNLHTWRMDKGMIKSFVHQSKLDKSVRVKGFYLSDCVLIDGAIHTVWMNRYSHGLYFASTVIVEMGAHGWAWVLTLFRF
jgi:hypothetical protein